MRDLIQLYATTNIRVAELERENAALRSALDAQMKYQRDLRADRDRLDWLETLDCDSTWWVHLADSTNLRAAIDAAREEAQP
jgi:anti-sigma factor RsiW